MFWLGYAGMPRRVLDYPASMGGWHSVISAGHMLSVAGLMAFFIMIFKIRPNGWQHMHPLSIENDSHYYIGHDFTLL